MRTYRIEYTHQESGMHITTSHRLAASTVLLVLMTRIIGGVRVDDSVPIRVAIHNAIRTGQNRDSTTIQRDSAESWPDCESPPEAIQESHAIHSRFGSERPEST